jgi:hypothetical protein
MKRKKKKMFPINRKNGDGGIRVKGRNYDDIDKRREKKKNRLQIFFLLMFQIEHHVDAPASLNGDSVDPMDTIDDCKSHVQFSITEAIRKSRSYLKTNGSSDTNNNYNKSETVEASNGHESPVNEFNNLFHSDQNNNDSNKSENGYRKLRNHQMQQLLQQHVFSPHQLQQLIAPPMTMSTPKDSLFHFEQKRKQMEVLMHQIQEQLHANILQQTHLLQNQSPTGEGGSKKGSSTFQLQQKLAIQQQELAQQFQLIQRQYLLHQSGMQLLFPQHHQQQIQSKFFSDPRIEF